MIAVPAADLRASAENVLRGNDNGAYTVPSRATYPHQWNWDSALAALGWAELDAGRAWTELEMLAGPRPAGDIPNIAFHTRVPERLNGRLRGALTLVARPYARHVPGPRWWGRRLSADGPRISGITQPPLAATCAPALRARSGRAAGARSPVPAAGLAPPPAGGARPARHRRAGAHPPATAARAESEVAPRPRGRPRFRPRGRPRALATWGLALASWGATPCTSL